jgi:hypothetical protein
MFLQNVRIIYWTACWHIPEHSNLHSHCQENLKSHKSVLLSLQLKVHCIFINDCANISCDILHHNRRRKSSGTTFAYCDNLEAR